MHEEPNRLESREDIVEGEEEEGTGLVEEEEAEADSSHQNTCCIGWLNSSQKIEQAAALVHFGLPSVGEAPVYDDNGELGADLAEWEL